MTSTVSTKIRWPDLSPYSLRLVSARLPTGETRLLMMGGDNQAAKVRRLGFVKYGSLWLRAEIKISKNEISNIFPNVRIVEMDRDDVFKVLRRPGQQTPIQKTVSTTVGQPVAPATRPITSNQDAADVYGNADIDIKTKVELESSILLGTNYLGQEVYESVEGRYIRGEKPSVTREDDSTSAIFLRGVTDRDLELCADGLVKEIVNGRFFHEDDIRNFVEVVLGEGKDDPVKQRRLHDGISHALARKMADGTSDSGPEAYALAIKLHEGLPPLNEERAERITPLPVGIVSQRLLAESIGKRIYIPQIANGSLTSALDNFSILTNEDPGEALSHIQNKSDVEVVDDVPKHDAMAANLTYVKLSESQNVSGIKTDRLDHAQILRSLSQRANKGRSIVMVKADPDSLDFLSKIASSHVIEGVAQLNSSLFGKGGIDNDRFLVCIGAVGSCEFNPASVKKVYDYGALWEWSDHMVSAAQRAAEKKSNVENSYQSPYIPASKVSEVNSMIPRNLAGPTHKALSNLQGRHGNIDDFVSRELRIPVSELGNYLDAGQVDAVGLAIDAHLRGRFFIEADQTGMGKGRVLAAMARYSILNGMKTVFITERPTLFSDFFRDIRDTGNMDLVNHFTINPNQPIILDGKKVLNGSTADESKFVINSGAYPEDANLVMATYSQFNRKSTFVDPDPKAEWLESVADGAFLLLDESHNAGGDSNTGENINRAIIKAKGCIFSSATFAKDPSNFFIYNRVMPPSVPSSMVPSVLEAGGDPLAEVFSAMLAEDGVMIRREHDLSDLRFETDVDYAHMERNEMLSNKLSEILEAFGVVSGEIGKFVNEKNRLSLVAGVAPGAATVALNAKQSKAAKVKNIGWRSTGVGSILYAAMRQFMMAIKTDQAIDSALKALNEGRKPVVVVENTMEALILSAINDNADFINGDFTIEDDLLTGENSVQMLPNDIATSQTLDIDLAAELESNDPLGPVGNVKSKNKLVFGETLMVPVTFNNVLHRILDRMMVINKVEDGKVTAVERVEMQKMIQLKQSIEMMIDAFPTLHISPIDMIKTKIEQRGFTCGEISGRSTGVITQDDGSQVVTKIKGSSNKTKIIYEFNEGYLDAMVLTTSGSTGISLHSSRQFSDQRTREMIELQIPNNVATRIQCFGRVNRKDQRCPPIIRTLVSGLPSEIRLLSMQNAKLREMSANTTSNRNNSILTQDFPDLLNSVGGKVCLEYLTENIAIAKRLCIDIERLTEDQWKKDKTWHANILTQRLGMLNVEDQRRIFDEINLQYNSTLEELNVKGINPFKTSEFDIGAKVIDEHSIFEPVIKSGSVFESPVMVRNITYIHKFRVANMDSVMYDIDKSRAQLREAYGANDNLELRAKVLLHLNSVEAGYLERSLSSRFETVKEALDDPEDNQTKLAWARMNTIKRLLPKMLPGNQVTVTNFFEPLTGVITKLKTPKAGGEQMMSHYEATVEVPGRGHIKVSMYGLSWDKNFESSPDITPAMMFLFNAPAEGSMVMERKVLCGNMFEAASWSYKNGKGTSIVYTDDKGERHRGVLLPADHVSLEIKSNIPVNPELAKALLDTAPNASGFSLMTTSTFEKRVTFSLTKKKEGGYWLKIPPGKSAEAITSRSTIFELQNLKLDKRNVIMSQMIDFPDHKVDTFIKEVYAAGMTLYAPNASSDFIREMAENILDGDIPNEYTARPSMSH